MSALYGYVADFVRVFFYHQENLGLLSIRKDWHVFVMSLVNVFSRKMEAVKTTYCTIVRNFIIQKPLVLFI